MCRLLLAAVLLLIVGPVQAQHLGQHHKSYGGSDMDLFVTMIKTSDGGSLGLGISKSDDGDVGHFQHGNLDVYVVKFTAFHSIQWRTVLGGAADDYGYSIVQLADGSYVLTGSTRSTSGDVVDSVTNLDVVRKHTSDADVWVIKLSPGGTIVWSRTFGGISDDEAHAIIKLSAGFLLAGSTTSTDGAFSRGIGQGWVAMLDDSGRVQWAKRYGGTTSDIIYSATELTSGTFVLAGTTASTDGDVNGNHGDYDYWLLGLNDTGNILWQRCLGAERWDQANSITACSDGDFLSIGWIEKDVNDRDVLLIKGHADGSVLWQKTYGGSEIDEGRASVETSDHGFVFVANVNSGDGDVAGLHNLSGAGFDFWVNRIDADGNSRWSLTAGGSEDDVPYGVLQLRDSLFLVGGYSSSNDQDITFDNHGNLDAWVAEIATTRPEDGVSFSQPDGALRLSYSNDAVLISFETRDAKPVSIELIDIMGRVTSIKRDAGLPGGQHIDRFSTTRLASGTYCIRIESDGRSEMRSFVVTH